MGFLSGGAGFCYGVVFMMRDYHKFMDELDDIKRELGLKTENDL